MIFNYYKKIEDPENNTIEFKRVNPEDIKICDKSVEEVIQILEGLELERIYDMKLTMTNLKKWIELINSELTHQLQAHEKEMLNKLY
jgi:hypothetical protein